MRKVLILDTSILCVWLRVPGKETCGPDNARWTYIQVKEKIDTEINQGAILILPFAAIIETGNHIAQSRGDRHRSVDEFIEFLEKSLAGRAPWAAFTEQSTLFGQEALHKTLTVWKHTALSGQSLGDAMIVEVANYYAAYNAEVEIFTGDEGLKAYEPMGQPVKRHRRTRRL